MATTTPISLFKRIFSSPPFRTFAATAKGLFIAHYISEHIYTVGLCQGPSMIPTISASSDWVLISRYHRRGRAIVVGDLVQFQSVINADQMVIKRIVGLEGDYVVRDTPGEGEIMVQVPEGHCWVAGDNLPASRDSRIVGPVPLALIRGKVEARVFPWRDRKWFLNTLERRPEV